MFNFANQPNIDARRAALFKIPTYLLRTDSALPLLL